MLNGFDISHYQNDRGAIDWSKLSQGQDFVFAKVTDGINYVDPYFKENLTNAKQSGLITGGYHFARFNDVATAQKEANWFVTQVKNSGVKIDFAVLDIEHREARGDLTEGVIEFLKIVSQVAQPLLYSYPNFIKNHFNDAIIEYPLWIAHYGVKSPTLYFWKQWKVWQYSSTANLDGIIGNVDVDYMDEDFAKKYVQLDTIKKKPTIQKVIKPKPIKTKKYTIQAGDNFWSLEEKWHIKHGTLQKLNSNANPKELSIGQKILIPADVHKEIKRVQRATKTYKVRHGDSLSEIAVKYNTSVAHIMSLNPQIKDPNVIFPGEIITIVKGSNNDTRKYHDVKSGETLSGIAKANNTTVQRLMQLNPNIDDKDVIYVGQKIRIA